MYNYLFYIATVLCCFRLFLKLFNRNAIPYYLIDFRFLFFIYYYFVIYYIFHNRQSALYIPNNIYEITTKKYTIQIHRGHSSLFHRPFLQLLYMFLIALSELYW